MSGCSGGPTARASTIAREVRPMTAGLAIVFGLLALILGAVVLVLWHAWDSEGD